MTMAPTRRIAEITGFSMRWVQKHAEGLLGGVKLGGHWRFDEAKIRAWIQRRETKPCHSTSAEISGGTGSSFKAGQFENRLDRLLAR